MNQNLREKAERTAELPYSVEVALDETTEGQPVYVARIPELEGCMGQGETIEQAVANLHEAKIDYIESLLEDGLSIPEPALLATTTSSSSSKTFTWSYTPRGTHDTDEKRPSRLYEAALLT